MLFYSHVNEDNRVERKVLAEHACPTVVAISGSGERVLALMDQAAVNTIIAVDVNVEALYLLELKLAVLRHLGTEDYLKFVGQKPATPAFRVQCFASIDAKLSAACQQYWRKHQAALEQGILLIGHFERFLQRIRPMLLFFLGNNFLKIFSEKTFPFESFPLWRWRLIRFFFAQSWVYRLWGNKDAAFVGSEADNKRIPAAIDAVLEAGTAASCFMLHLIFKGHLQDMQEVDLPPSLQFQVLERIRERLQLQQVAVEYCQGDVLDFVLSRHAQLPGPVFYALSDLLSFVDYSYLHALIRGVATSEGNPIVWRSFLRNQLSAAQLQNLTQMYGEISQLDDLESTKMYRVFAQIPSLNSSPQI